MGIKNWHMLQYTAMYLTRRTGYCRKFCGTLYLCLLTAICVSISMSLVAVSDQKTDVDSPIVLAGVLRLESADGNDNTLVYDADTRIGAILHDAFFTIKDITYNISRIEVTPDRFSLHIQQNGHKVNEAVVLADRYIVFKKEFSAIGYIDANMLTPHTTHPNMASIPLTSANGLQKNDFLSYRAFEITAVKPVVNRYPEEIQPLPTITHRLTDKPSTLLLTEYYKDPENTRLSFYASLDGNCCIVHHVVQGNILTITPIGIGTTAIEVGVYDASGFLEIGIIEIEILPGDLSVTKDAVPPIIINEKIIEIPSAIAPAITITVDHQAYAGENLRVIFGESGACKQLSSDIIEGTSIDNRATKPIYIGTLTGSSGETNRIGHGYLESEQIGVLTPATVEIEGTVYRIVKLLYNGTEITIHITEDGAEEADEESETVKTYPDLSDHYLVFKGKNKSIISHISIKDATTIDQGTLTIPLSADSPLRDKKLFDGTTRITVELTVNKPGNRRVMPPQTYITTIKGPPGIYTDCTLTVKDESGNEAEEAAVLSVFTILRTEEEKEEEMRQQHPKAHAPIVPDQETPKKQWSLLIEQKEKEGGERLLQIGRLALRLARPDISTSSVQKVNLGRQSHIPEVKNLQIFLNLAGYTVAQTGWGSRGMETEYFGPATEKAVKVFQKENDIPVTGDLDQETKMAILNLILTKLEEHLNNQ